MANMNRNQQRSTRRPQTSHGAFVLALATAALAVTTPQARLLPQNERAAIASARPASVNRTVPKVSPPAPLPVFSKTATEAELRRARVFPEPLLPLGTPSAPENHALAASLAEYARAGRASSPKPLETFLAAYPSSAWRASLLVNLAGVHRSSGFFTTALKEWSEAWTLAEHDNSREGRAIGDMAAASALEFLATLGHARGLDEWLTRVEGRQMRGPAAARVARAREARAIVRTHPEKVRPSGPLALQVLLTARSGKGDPVTVPALTEYRTTEAGTTLAELRTLAAKVGLDLQPARRERGTVPIVPSIVHLGFEHYSALVKEEHGAYALRDPALGGLRWMPREALEQETSGYALVPAGDLPAGWSKVSDSEANIVVGRSCPPGQPSPDDNMCPIGGDQGSSGGGCSGGCGPSGMPVYGFDPLQASIILRDAPVGYVPPRGPEVTFRMRYNSREENEPQVFSFANLGPKWWPNWLAYVEERPGSCTTVCTQNESAVHVPEGGVERYMYGSFDFDPANWVGHESQRHFRSAAVLVVTSAVPIRYERRLPDGSKEIYDVSDGAVVGQRRIFLSKMVDPHGQEVQFTWDGQLRLVAVTDAIGQVTTLQYDDAADPLHVTSVTDPFSRTATLTYTAEGTLASVTDVAGLTSTFSYGGGDVVTAMTTPYGTSTFRTPSMAAEYDRAVEATDPVGGAERVEFRYLDAPVPASLPPEQVPPAWRGVNSDLNQHMSLYWGKGASFSRPDDATQFQWGIITNDIFADPGWSVGVPLWKQEPGHVRTWYDYASQSGTGYSTIATAIGRQLIDGTTYQMWRTRNVKDRITEELDAAGRDTKYVYAANGVDLLEVRNVTAGRNDVLARYADYTAAHQPQTLTDAAGQSSHMTYNAAGQVLTVTNAKQEQTTYLYDPNGFLQSVTGPVAGATTTYTYDVYGRVRTITSDAVTVTTDYDTLDRPTRVTYPDGTYEETTYDRLDVATRRDRRGRITRYTYTARRQLAAVRDPAGRVVQQQWGVSGALDALVDAKAQVTRWERDLGGRVVREVRADGLTDTDYTYDGFGRLKTVTDPKQQVTTYTYTVDGAVSSVAYTNAQIATPGVTWTYDPAYARVSSMADGTGTTSYTYHPVGQLGAGQVATVDGPLTNDVISYTYDELGRVVTRAIDGVPLTLTYDTLGRVAQEVNALGTFTYGYDGVTGRLATVTYPNGQTSTYSYFPAAQDHRLQTIHHKYPNGTTLSRFDYTYDTAGNILTWRQQADATAVIWEYGYDNADQLTRAVKKATDPQGTILQGFAYGYDPAGNRLFEQIDDQVTSWTYDRLNRLVDQRAGGMLRVAGSVDEPAIVRVGGQPATVDANGIFVGGVSVGTGTTPFTVTATDASGNTSTRTFEIDQAGGAKTFTFDANGNLTSDGMRILEWDARDQLVAVTVGTHRTEFTYDGMHRRVRRIAKENGTVQSDAHFIFCPMTICVERTSSGTVRRMFTRGEQSSGDPQFFVTDHLGTIAAVSDGSSMLLARYEYDPWGRREVTTGNDVVEAGFTGHRWEPEAGVALASLRAYDPTVGRWTSEDPAGMADGPNRFAYTQNSPISSVDPRGTVTVDITSITFRTVKTWDDFTRAAGGRFVMNANGFTYGPIQWTCKCLPTDCGYRAQISIKAEIHVVAIDNPQTLTTPIMIFAEELVHITDRLELISKLKRYGEELESKRCSSQFQCQVGCIMFSAYAYAGMAAISVRDYPPFRTHGPIRRDWSR